MTLTPINVGTSANDGTGDPLRTAYQRCNAAIAAINSGGLAWLIKTATYTAISGDRIQADTTGGAFTITLPATPTVGDTILIEDSALSWAAAALTLGRNSLKINGGTSNFTANVAGAKLSCVYISTAYGWSIK
jgi:Ran-binding protein 9/10